MPHTAQRDALGLEGVDGRLVIVDRLGHAFVFQSRSQPRARGVLHRNR